MERLARASHHGPTLLYQSCLCGMDMKVNFRVAVMSGEAAPPDPIPFFVRGFLRYNLLVSREVVLSQGSLGR
jgi:hypothetical protein